MTIDFRDIEYEADGRTMVGRLALPEGEDVRPAILIAHEGPGLDELQRDRASRLAESGYVAFALDYHGGGVPLADRETMRIRLDELFADSTRTRALGNAGLDVLLSEQRADPARIAAIGYCFGGHLALEMARGGVALTAIVGFHPGLRPAPAAEVRRIAGSVLVCIGDDDPLIPPEDRSMFAEQMTAAGVDWQMHVYGGVQHSFTHPWAHEGIAPGIAYDADADRRSWSAMLELFDSVF